MENHNLQTGADLLSLLRQERYLYHQLRILTERQQQLTETDPPEMLLEVINGRRKLAEKLYQLNSGLRLIKANWDKLLSQIEPEYKIQAEEMAGQVRQIIEKIQAIAPSETNTHLPLRYAASADELFAETLS